MKVTFVTDSGFFSHKQEILTALNKKLDLQLIIFFTKGFKNNSANDILSFCTTNNIKNEIVLKGKYRAKDPRRIIYDYNSIIKKIKDYNPDIIYVESFGSPYLTILYALFFQRKRLVVGIHDFKLHKLTKEKTSFSARIYQKLATLLFFNFHFFSFSQAKLFEKKYPMKNSFVIRLFLVEASDSSVIKRDDDNKINFLFFGRIFYYKGVDILIKATNILAKKHNNFKVTIAGNTNEWNTEYQQLIDEKSFFDLKIRFISKEELPRLFSNADFFVAPYREVTQSGPLLRAYNYDIIPIVSSEEGFKEYVEHNKTGFVFENEDENSLATEMEKALLQDNFEKEKILSNIDEFKKSEFDIKNVINNYIQMFKDVKL